MEKESKIKDEEVIQSIIEELKSMYDADQLMRHAAERKPELWNEGLDKKHTRRLKEIIDQIGWPTASKVGWEGQTHAWLLAQHADHDLEFQKRCLALMKAESDEEVSRPHIAFLDDRIAVAEGRPQLYGTQFFYDEDGKLKPRPIFESENIEKRRREMYMGTFEEYERMMRKDND